MSEDKKFNDMPFNTKGYSDDFRSNSLLKDNLSNINNSYLNRHFYQVPKNNQDRLANLLFPNTSICRDSGYTCKLNETNSTSRLSYLKL